MADDQDAKRQRQREGKRARDKRHRQNEREGLSVLPILVHRERLIDRMVKEGRLPERDSGNLEALKAVVAALVAGKK